MYVEANPMHEAARRALENPVAKVVWSNAIVPRSGIFAWLSTHSDEWGGSTEHG